MNNSVTTPDISAATLAVTNLSGALHGLHTYLGQEAAQNALLIRILTGIQKPLALDYIYRYVLSTTFFTYPRTPYGLTATIWHGTHVTVIIG